MSEHTHDCPRCDGYFVCTRSSGECGPDDLCYDCQRDRIAKLEAEIEREITAHHIWQRRAQQAETEAAKVVTLCKQYKADPISTLDRPSSHMKLGKLLSAIDTLAEHLGTEDSDDG